MNITENYPVTIYRKDYEGKIYYKVGLSKKNQDGSFTNGYIPCQFKNGVSVDDKTKIYIKNAWLTFYLKDKETKPYIFISEFETVGETIENAKKEVKEETKDPYEEFGQSIVINEDDLPF